AHVRDQIVLNQNRQIQFRLNASRMVSIAFMLALRVCERRRVNRDCCEDCEACENREKLPEHFTSFLFDLNARIETGFTKFCPNLRCRKLRRCSLRKVKSKKAKGKSVGTPAA